MSQLDVIVSRCGAVLSLARIPAPAFCPVCQEPLDANAVAIALAATLKVSNPTGDPVIAAAVTAQATTDLTTTTVTNAYGLQETT